MGTDTVEFGSGELRLVGGDYGQIHLEGTTPEARAACDAIVAAARRSGGRSVCLYSQFEFDDTPDLFEDRHAGLEGTTRIERPGPDSTADEGGTEGGPGERPAPRPE